MKFSDYNLDEMVLKGLETMGYDAPTDVQEQLIPTILKGDSALVKAQTGSGKTAAFGIPLIERVDWSIREPQVMVITPTRELALQVREELFHIGRYKRLNVVALYGKAPFEHQQRDLKGRVHIVVGTPGRIMDHIRQETLDVSAMKALVIDEADELLRMGFIDQVEEIVESLSHREQTLLLSATLPDEIQSLVSNVMDDYATFDVVSNDDVRNRIDQHVVYTNNKEDALYRIIVGHEFTSAMIFCNTKKVVDEVYRSLKNDLPIQRLHGDMSQKDRTRVMNDFKKGKYRYLVASDVAARGLDIDALAAIVNYDVPHTQETYTHRIGRTARLDQDGVAITLVDDLSGKLWDHISDGMDVEKQQLPHQDRVRKIEGDFINRMNSHREVAQIKHNDIVKLHIKGGKNQKIRPGDIVGAITSIEGIEATDLGVIQVLEESTYVEILNGKGKTVLNALQQIQIKGKKRRVERSKKD